MQQGRGGQTLCFMKVEFTFTKEAEVIDEEKINIFLYIWVNYEKLKSNYFEPVL